MKTGLLLSGGMDSIALAWWKRPNIALTVDYGQMAAAAELEASSSFCKSIGIEHHIIHVDCRSLGSGDMAGTRPNSHAPESDWWPFRNQMLATFAGMKAISLGVSTLWFGTVKTDERHSDGRQDFFENLTSLMASQEGGIRVEAPAIQMTTQELIHVSQIPREYLAFAHSCHTAHVPCGSCRGCNKYNQTYESLGNELG